MEHFTTRAQARAAVAAWIDDYNQDRRHSSIGMQTPIALRARRLTMTCTRPASVVPSSPASRPSPSGVASGQPGHRLRATPIGHHREQAHKIKTSQELAAKLTD